MAFYQKFIYELAGIILLPKDIVRKINDQYKDLNERNEVKGLISKLWKMNLNVGAPQLARSILTIANGNINEVKKITTDFYGDPRDVLMKGEEKLGNPGHYFIFSFDIIDKT
jgi:hypothetical protein